MLNVKICLLRRSQLICRQNFSYKKPSFIKKAEASIVKKETDVKGDPAQFVTQGSKMWDKANDSQKPKSSNFSVGIAPSFVRLVFVSLTIVFVVNPLYESYVFLTNPKEFKIIRQKNIKRSAKKRAEDGLQAYTDEQEEISYRYADTLYEPFINFLETWCRIQRKNENGDSIVIINGIEVLKEIPEDKPYEVADANKVILDGLSSAISSDFRFLDSSVRSAVSEYYEIQEKDEKEVQKKK